jgi:three-Cys-motif partner protein
MGKRRADRWPELKAIVTNDDGLPVRKAGPWTLDKLYFWHRYIEITTQALADDNRWPDGIVYVDLFGGPGVCVAKGTRTRLPGSTMIAANAKKPFRRIIVCEQDVGIADACRQRLSKTPVAANCIVLQGDCNCLIDEVVRRIPKGALTLAFIDPTGLHAQFETIRKLSTGRAVDLLILFADALDVVRNFDRYATESNSNLDQVLGPDSNWREGYRQLARHDEPTLRVYFGNVYKEQLRKHLGYRHFSEKVMGATDMPLYRLLFASKHPLGLKFWQAASKKDRRGQGEFDF